ncbi:MAG: hypothetical protein R2799_13260 [Crocinitomicaceae bacterium]
MVKKLLVVALTGFLFACGGEKKEDSGEKSETGSKKITKFSGAQYTFSDSSVEPRYARSWSVGVDGSKVHFEIRSYDEILLIRDFDLNQEQAKLLNDVITNLEGIEDLKHTNESGSSAEGLTIYSGEEVVAQAFWNTGANPSISDFTLAMKSLVPNFDELMQLTVINGPIVFLSNAIPEDVNLEEFNALAEKYDFQIVPDAESSEEERKEINAMRMKMMSFIQPEDWQKKFEVETGNSLEKFNL